MRTSGPREDNNGAGWCVREVHEGDAVTSTTDVYPCRRQGLGILIRYHWMMGVGGRAHIAVPAIEEGQSSIAPLAVVNHVRTINAEW